MACFLCKKALKSLLNTVIKEDSGDIGKICEKCNQDWKEFCSSCKTLKKFSDIKYDLEGRIICSECQKTKLNICLKCSLRAIFMCTCEKFYCKFCAEIHFVKVFNEEIDKGIGLKKFKHKFIGTGNKSYLPDFYEDILKSIIEFYYENEDYFTNKNFFFQRIVRLADIYTFGMNLFKFAEDSIDPIVFALKLAPIKFAAGHFSDTKMLLNNILDSILSDDSNIEEFLNYFIYFSLDLNPDKSSRILDKIKPYKKNFTQISKYNLFKAWFSYLKTKNKKAFGEFILENWRNPSSIHTLQLFIMAGLFTNNLKKLEDCINYLVFYFQSTPELSLIYEKKSTLIQDKAAKSKSLFVSFQIILRFSDFSNESLVSSMIRYLQNQVHVNKEEASLYYMRLLEECLLNKHQVHFKTLKDEASVYISDSSLISKIKQLSL